MSDYLGALISRSFDPSDVVRPRPVSRFERRSPDLESVPREDAAPSLAAPDAGIPGRDAGAPREVSTFSRHDDSLVPPFQTTEPPASRVTTATPAPLSPRARDAGVRPAPAREQERTEAVPVATPVARGPSIQPIRYEVIMERPAEPPRSREPRPRAPSQPSHATTPAVLPAAVLPRPVPDSPPRPIESAAVIEPRRTAQASPRSAPPSEPPAIHVTIGRIEIRATSPAAAPVRRQHRQPSVMSLDEYLKQCAGGGPR